MQSLETCWREENEKDESNRFECVVLIQMMKWKNAFEKPFETHKKESFIVFFPFLFPRSDTDYRRSDTQRREETGNII